MASTGEASRRHLAAGAAVITALTLAFQFGWMVTYRDRGIAEAAGRQLLSGHLDVYAHMPEAQMGPLALLIAGGLSTGAYIVVLSLALYPLLYLGFTALRVTPTVPQIAGAALVGAVWHRFPITGHADDVLVLAGAVMLMLAKREGLPSLAAVAFVVSIAGKPTAVLLLPLVWLVSRRAALWAVAGAAVVWLPFALADVRGFLDAGGGVAPVWPYSLPGLLGAEAGSPYPWWVRPAQLVVGLAVCWVVARRAGFVAAFAAVLATRAFFEPGTYPLYWQSIIVAAFLVDLNARWRVPWTTVAALGGWLVTLNYALTPTAGLARLGLLVAVAALAVVSGSTSTAGQWSRPTSPRASPAGWSPRPTSPRR